jgi:hypothetical protein
MLDFDLGIITVVRAIRNCNNRPVVSSESVPHTIKPPTDRKKKFSLGPQMGFETKAESALKCTVSSHYRAMSSE